MNNCTIKFKFDLIDDYLIENIFNNVKYLLNYQFDNDSNVFFVDSDVDYQIKDVSNLNSEYIESIINSFFNYEFEDTLNVFLYKFLVLKNNDKFTLLAIIHPSIFNYSLLNDFYELFYNVDNVRDENYLTCYYEDVKNYLNSSDYDEDSAYWRDIALNAGNYVKFHNLKSGDYKRHKFEIDKEPVLNFIKNQDCSIFNFYTSAFSLYLSRINRQNGCLLKTDIPSKGPSLKTILKMDLNSTSFFTDYLHQFNSIYEEVVSHTKVSIENYVDEDLSYYSIYDFSNLNENICIHNGYDSALTLNIYNNHLEIVYNADLFSDIFIQHMADNIQSMVNNLVEFPNHLLKDVNILSEAEEKLLSDFCKGEDADVDEDLLIAGYFRSHALENPDAIAVDDGVSQISYGELEKSSNSIANDLFENYDISLNSHVCLILPRNYHYPELVLALNKLGAVFIPIDPIYPLKRIEHMLEISEAECIITDKDIAGKFDFDLDTICIEDLNCDDDVDVEIVATGENLFSIMFTSGTTGLPKGVKISNHQAGGLLESFKNIFSFSYGDLIGCYLSFSFIASYVIFLAFMFGGGCRIFNENEQKDILALIKVLKENPMNSLFLPPALAVPILESGDIKLDYLALAGGKLKELSKRQRSTQLINFYGTTEIVFGVTKVYDFKDIEEDNLPIGRPVTNTNVYILDENSNQMPIGVPGEICVSSKYISPGYYNNPELTDEVFVDNPYSDSENNKIMYRTGDIGFYNFDGDIEILGREDDQLSVRGFRIESGEILNIVNSIPEIENVYLDAENDTLSLYYTTNAEIDVDYIKEKLMGELPNYMIPSLFMELEEIPLNMNGKIDKVKLKKMSKVNVEIDIEDEVLAGVVDAFKEVLDMDLILVNDNFVELGGNSLSAMKLQILFREKFHVNISSPEIIELSTPNNICNYIKSNFKSLPAIDEIRYTFDEGCPLSESQLNVYLDESVNNMGTAYNNSFKIEFRNNYSVDEIKNALIKLFDVFPVLKARVLNNDDMPSLIFDAEPEISEGSLNDMQSFVKPFEFDKCLSRFLIVDDATSILCADFHHLIFDGTSLNILLNKLYSILDNQDIDFIDKGVLRQVSFEELINSDYMDDAHELFDDMLADRDEVYGLLPSLNGTDEEFELIDAIDIDAEYLSSFLQNHSMTYNQFFTSVFAYTLSRFSGSEKVLFNIIEDGRGHIDLSQSVGMFVKTLPLLMDCKNQDIDSYLEYSSKLINSVMKYDLYPFHVLASDYDLNSNILFQYSHDLFSDVVNNKELKYSVDELKHDLNADLSFYIFNNGENSFTIRILYSSIYSKNFIECFTQSYKLILNELIKVDELKDIDYISCSDVELLDSYNQTKHKLSHDDILDEFNDNLSRYENNILVGYENTSYTHGQGAFIANEVADKLDNLGVVKQDHVALFVNRSEWFLLASMGVLSMGSIYVPIDTEYPDERVIFMLEDTKSKVVIVDNDSAKRMKNIIVENDLNIDVLNVSNITSGDISASKHLNSVEVDDGDIACILYTSGTIGAPKGVLITRKAINNFVSWYVDETKFTSSDVYGMHCSYVFDMHTHALYSPVITGGSLYVVPEDIRLDLKALNDYYVEHGCTHTYITSQVGKLFAESGMETTIKLLCFGGMKLGELNAPDSIGPFESYGPSENLAISTSIFANRRIHHSSIGRFISNVKGYVLDKELRRVPLGAVGELYLAGSQLTPGYLNRNEENDKAFFDNPFDNEKDYNRIYGTGDMVRFLPDGTLGIVGRRDGQVKIRGNRVELSEIESAIREIEYIEDLTVQTIKNGTNNELVAYVVVSDEFDGDLKEEISNHVDERKPNYMIPTFVIELDEIPLNVNGKVDKRALPDVDMDSLRVKYVAPTTETEKLIVNAFEEVFNQDNIGVYDDFTRLGGDSLTAIKVLPYLSDYNVTAADILSLRTPFAIAENIKENTLNLDIYSLESGCPLNEPQLNVYLDIVANDKFDIYLIPSIMEIGNEYDVESILKALDVMLDVHPILGTCIRDDKEIPYLVKGSKPSIEFRFNTDDDYLIEFLTKPFDLYDGLCRFRVVRNDDGYLLYAVFHHIIFDALSVGVFKKDLQTILDEGRVDVDVSFLKVSAFSQQIQETDEYADANLFYDEMLADVDEAGGLLDSGDGDGPGIIQLNLELDLTHFKSFLTKYNVSENVLFTGVFAYTLSRFAGSNRVFFNVTENGRGRFNNYNAIGMYVNTLPMIVDCKDTNVSDFMEYMSDLVYDVMKYNYYPFRLLAKEYGIDSSILFQFIPEWIDNTDADNTEFESIQEDSESESAEHLINDLSIDIIQKGKSYSICLQYSARYSGDVMNRFAESYKSIISQIICVDKLSEINYVSDSDLELLDTYNQTEHALKYKDVLEAFNDNLAKYPDANLVSYNENVYTYAEGAFIADKLANTLKELGIEKQNCVAFLVERSELYMFCVLGILSVGATYVPLDDKHPNERIGFIIKDTESKVIIVTDKTYEHAKSLSDSAILLNISEMMKEDVGTLVKLPVVYGNLACILYTSGTTGRPKGVKITRKSLLNLSEFYIRKYDLCKDDVYALFASIGFDVGIKAIFPTICSGACLTVVPDEIKLDMNAMNKYFIEHGVTHTEITTPVAKLFISQVDETSLKVLTTGGEKLGESKIDVDYRFVDSYGPTEACVDVTSIDFDDRINPSSIGYLLDNVKAYVLDEELRRVPFGAIGELYLAGYQIADGYLNLEEETSKAFIDNPFENSEDYNVIYRTGDMVCYLNDGSLAIIGRRDSQVKIRGNRVELSEIESSIREIEYVRDVTVQTIKHDTNNELVAYVVVSTDMDENELKDSICDYVNKYKPNYMVPSYVLKLDAIPLNVNGKVDKRALPDVEIDSLYAEYVAPRNENEKEIVEAFEKAFNLDKISIYDDFIRLGGDSLKAVKLLNYIESDDVTMADVFTFRTPEAIAKNMSEFSFDLDIYSLEEGCPLNSAQLNVFGDVMGYNKENAYHMIGYIPISKNYGLEKILDSLDELLDMHPILSTHLSEKYEESDNDMSNLDLLRDLMKTAKKFGMKKIIAIAKKHGISDVNGLYKMIKTVIKLFKGDYPYLVKGDKPQISVKSKLDKNILIDFFAESFDLYNYLSKFMIVESEKSYYLFYMIHHIIFDAASAGIFKRDIQTLLDGGSIDFDDTFLKTSAFTHQIKNTEKFHEAEEFYHSLLSDIGEVGSLLEDNPSAEGYSMPTYDLEFDKTAFKSFLKNVGISENVLFTSVFSYTLSQFVNSNKVLFVISENGRDRFNENFICMTSNVMPVVIDCKDQSISSYIADVADTVFGVIRCSYYPILLLYQKYNFEANVVFQYTPNWVAEDFTKDLVKIENINSEEIYYHILNEFSDSISEVFVEVCQNGDEYTLIITHSNKYSNKLVEDFKNMFITVLSNIINADVSSNLSDTLK